MSRVSATRPSVEFSIGTRPKSASPRLTSSKTAAMVPTGHELDRLAEAVHGRQMAVAVERSEVRDPQRPDECPRAARAVPERPPGPRFPAAAPCSAAAALGERIVILGRDEGGLAGRVFPLTDLPRDRRPTIDRLDDLAVEPLQFAPESAVFGGTCGDRSCPSRLFAGPSFLPWAWSPALRVRIGAWREETGLPSTCIGGWRACQRTRPDCQYGRYPGMGIVAVSKWQSVRVFASAVLRSVVAMDNVSY